MDTRKVATEYRLAQWGQMIQARVQSGQSINEFCASVGVSRNAYFYWQRKLREAACTELAARDKEPETSLIPSGWSRLEPEMSEPSAPALKIEISGCRVEVTAETNPELLAKVCRTLKAL